ncbi:hypothetical protein ETAA8_40170 [Anatilimnocola aggregata]|uniref:Uncharacterized protein n=1 Tax=Anatilimnocola aggregata TaxID=2528021 RepID=A0A517YFC3_9BACT|nr:hypothetical protein ETAA8_40170 [Anatilimnocola aggregata]
MFGCRDCLLSHCPGQVTSEHERQRRALLTAKVFVDATYEGESYEFCCPPCISEFVRDAKDEPDKIQTDDRYLAK